MKRILSVSILLLSVCSVFAYDDTDVTTANSLASQNIIVDQSQSPEKYNLDAKILRQEVIGMALKIKGITIPDNYTCKGYYSDTKQNDWVCRAIEMAADNGVITHSNQDANPGKYVTRAEALAMLMKAGGLAGEITEVDPPLSDLEISYIFDGANAWQQEIIEKAAVRHIVDLRTMKNETIGKDGEYGVTIHIGFHPNREATRAEVFDFVKKIKDLESPSTLVKPMLYTHDNAEYTIGYEENMRLYIDEPDSFEYMNSEDENIFIAVKRIATKCESIGCNLTDSNWKKLFGNNIKILQKEIHENDILFTVEYTGDGGEVSSGYIKAMLHAENQSFYIISGGVGQKGWNRQYQQRIQDMIQSFEWREKIHIEDIKNLFDTENIYFGSADNKLIFVEISDPSCPACHIVDGYNPELNAGAGDAYVLSTEGGPFIAPGREIEQLVRANKAAYIWVFMSAHGNGELAASALYCANEQGKFWEAKKRLMSAEGLTLMNDVIQNDTSKVDLMVQFLKDTVDVKSCLESGKYSYHTNAATNLLNINAVPVFIVNENIFPGVINYKEMKTVVDTILK